MLEFTGMANFRYRVALSYLTLKPIRITHIRTNSVNIGLNQGEVKFLQLIEKLTTSSRIVINKTGTNVEISPGIITNNSSIPIQFECGNYYPISYYILGILPIVALGKEEANIEFTGITNTPNYASIESITLSVNALWKSMSLGSIKIQLKERSFSPYGTVILNVDPIAKFDDYILSDIGKIKKIRGTAFACKTSTEILNRMIAECKTNLGQYCGDVWLHSEYKGRKKEDELQGYSVQLYAETSKGYVLTADACYQGEKSSPESVAALACQKLMYEILRIGAMDENFQAIYILMMCLSKSSTVSLGSINTGTKMLMQDIKKVTGVVFEIDECEEESEGLILSCIGQNMTNIALKNTIDA